MMRAKHAEKVSKLKIHLSNKNTTPGRTGRLKPKFTSDSVPMKSYYAKSAVVRFDICYSLISQGSAATDLRRDG